MPRIFLIALGLSLFSFLWAAEDGPLISIPSPDKAVTFAYGTIKNHTLIWSKKYRMLYARVTFTDAEQASGQPSEDAHEFRLPGISFDEAKGIFYATSPKGVLVPVAQMKQALFFKTVAPLPNANVRIQKVRSDVTVILEAISPDDPALHVPPPDTNPDHTHKVDPAKIVQ